MTRTHRHPTPRSTPSPQPSPSPATLAAGVVLLATSMVTARTASPTPETHLGAFHAPLTASWPDNRLVYLVCHGHSVPAGYFRTPAIRPFDSYPHLTHRIVQDRYPTAMFEVVRTAIGGENAEQGAARFEEDVLAKKPDVVTIDYGLNDRGIGLERARAAWVSMIEAAQAAGVRVILLTPTGDTSANPDDPADPLVLHAEQIRQLAKEYGTGLVDSFALFQAYRREHGTIAPLMSQSNHPNRAGHALVAQELAMWFTQIKPEHKPD